MLNEKLQTLPYFWNKKTQIIFHFELNILDLLHTKLDALVYVNDTRRKSDPPSTYFNKSKVAQNEKNMAKFIPILWKFLLILPVFIFIFRIQS